MIDMLENDNYSIEDLYELIYEPDEDYSCFVDRKRDIKVR